MKILNLPITNVLLLLIIVSCLAGCEEKEKFSLNATEIILHRKQTFTLFDPAYASKCVCTSENENIASISGNGVITGELVGETNIRVRNIDEGFDGICKVKVNPQYEMYREPYLVFGKQKADIKSYEIRLLSLETDTSIMYAGENSNILGVVYFFKNSAYYICECLIPAIQVGLLSNYLQERYYVASNEDGIVIMLSPDGYSLVALVSISASYYVVIYVDATNLKGSAGLKSNSDWSGLF